MKYALCFVVLALLASGAARAEPSGLTLLLEPVNTERDVCSATEAPGLGFDPTQNSLVVCANGQWRLVPMTALAPTDAPADATR